jgi:heptosyltransferase-3
MRMEKQRILRKELIGWSVLGRHYRLHSPLAAAAMRCIDCAGEMLFCLRQRSMPQSPRRIAVIQLDHVGDMFLAGRFLANLKAAYPEAAITVIGREMCREAALLLDGIDEFSACNAPWLSRNDSMGWKKFSIFCIKMRKHFDMAFDLHGDPRNNLLARILAHRSVGFGFRGMGFMLTRRAEWDRVYLKHITDMQLTLLKAADANTGHHISSIRIPDASKIAVRAMLDSANIRVQEFILIQTSSGRRIKDWPVEHWERFIELHSAASAIVTADRNTEVIERLKRRAAPGTFFDISLDLAGYAALVSMARIIVSVDTFTVHLAYLLKKPVTALYSGTNLVEEWGPMETSAQNNLLQDRTCPKFPCYIMHNCPYGYPSPCMRAIRPEAAG